MLLIEPEMLKNQVDNYFEQIEKSGKFILGVVEYKQREPSITGLALFLGFSSVNQFKTYADRLEYAEQINYALLRLGMKYEELLQDGNKNALVGLKRLDKEWVGDASITQVGVNVSTEGKVESSDLADRLAMIRAARVKDGVSGDGSV